jgi:hypothetical protein
MLVACRLAGLSALEAHWAGLSAQRSTGIGAGELRGKALLGCICFSVSRLQRAGCDRNDGDSNKGNGKIVKTVHWVFSLAHSGAIPARRPRILPEENPCGRRGVASGAAASFFPFLAESVCAIESAMSPQPRFVHRAERAMVECIGSTAPFETFVEMMGIGDFGRDAERAAIDAVANYDWTNEIVPAGVGRHFTQRRLHHPVTIRRDSVGEEAFGGMSRRGDEGESGGDNYGLEVHRHVLS